VDECGLSSSVTQKLIVNYPVLTFPPPVNVECGNDTSPASMGTPFSTDRSFTFSYNDSIYIYPGCTDNIYNIITRRWSVTDWCGTRTYNQNINVLDHYPPEITYENITLDCGDIPDIIPLPDSVKLTVPTAKDTCIGSVPVIFEKDNKPSKVTCINQFLDIRRTERYWNTTDTCNNAVKFKQTIFFKDTTAPYYILAPHYDKTSISLVSASNCIMSVVAEKIGDLNRTISYDDNCDKNFYLLQEDLGASITGNCESYVHTWKLTDWCNNTFTYKETIPITITKSNAYSLRICTLSFLILWLLNVLFV